MGRVDPTGAILITVTGEQTILEIAGDAASRVSFRKDHTVDTSQLTDDDLRANEGALLLRQMDVSSDVYTYREAQTAMTAGGMQQVDGVLNLDDNPFRGIVINGVPRPKTAGFFPSNGVNGGVTVDPTKQYYDQSTRSLAVPKADIAFHELAESHAKVQNNIPRGPHHGPGAHHIARLREVILMLQRPNWTPYPAGGLLTR
jgi:hypothetical protein